MSKTATRARRLVLAVLFASSAVAVTAQTRGGRAAATLNPESLSTKGLTSGATLQKLFVGDFNGIDFDRNDPKFNGIFDQYLVAYSRHCEASLPANKVEMTKEECQGPRVKTEVRNGWGTLISSSTSCSEWVTVRVGWAKPSLYSAKKALDRQRAADTGRELSQVFSTVMQQNTVSSLMAQLEAARAVADDIDGLVKQNDCTGPGLGRFEQNLVLFGENRPPLRIDGKAAPEVAASSEMSRRNQDFTRLISDLVEEDARNWGAFAKYVQGSITQTVVKSKDPSGLPAEIAAPYSWDGMAGRTTGTVTLRLTDGLPNCFYYSETSSVCHAASRKIVTAYSQGSYQK